MFKFLKKKTTEKVMVFEETKAGQLEVFPLSFNIGERLPVNGDILNVRAGNGQIAEVRIGAILGMNWAAPQGSIIVINRAANRHPQKLIVTVAGTRTIVKTNNGDE